MFCIPSLQKRRISPTSWMLAEFSFDSVPSETHGNLRRLFESNCKNLGDLKEPKAMPDPLVTGSSASSFACFHSRIDTGALGKHRGCSLPTMSTMITSTKSA